MKQDIARFEQVKQRTQEVMEKAKALFGVDVSSALIKFDLTGRVAGFAGCRYCAISGRKNLFLRFNCDIINGDQFEEFLADTIPHEIAHLCGYMDPKLGRKHDSAWRRTCVALGGSGSRTHNYDVVVRGRWDYLTDLGNKVSVSKKYHAYVQAGGSLTFKKGLGQINRSSPCAPSGQLKVVRKPDNTVSVSTAPKTDITQAPKTDIRKAPRVNLRTTKTVNVRKDGEMTWAEKVRRLIRAQKGLGVSMDTVIVLAIQDLGMTKERAKSCVKAHWDKVQ